MRRSVMAMVIMALTLSGLPAFGAAQPDVRVTLSAHRISTTATGKESITSGDSAKPGEIIEYRAVYKNVGSAAARKLHGMLPIPAEMEYSADSAVPAGVQASTDGTSYAAIPLKRKVKLANGTVTSRTVPPSEYTSLRWNLKDLAPGASVTVSARMKIKDNQQGPVIIKLDSVKKSEGKQKGGEK